MLIWFWFFCFDVGCWQVGCYFAVSLGALVLLVVVGCV